MHYRKSVFRSLAMVTQLGLCVLTPVLFCVFIGYQIDSRFSTGTMIPLLILGVLGGGRGAWMMARRTLLQEQKEDERIKQEKKSGQAKAGVSRPKQESRILQAKKEADKDGMVK